MNIDSRQARLGIAQQKVNQLGNFSTINGFSFNDIFTSHVELENYVLKIYRSIVFHWNEYYTIVQVLKDGPDAH